MLEDGGGSVFERFSLQARGAVDRAFEEAGSLGHGFVGTEHLLLALTKDGEVRPILERLGVTREWLLGEYRGVVGACDPPRTGRPDPTALASVGIDLEEVRRHVERTFGSGALERTRAWRDPSRLPFTPRAKRVISLALREAVALGDRRLLPRHLLLGLAAVDDGLAARLLHRRGASLQLVRSAVANAQRRPA